MCAVNRGLGTEEKAPTRGNVDGRRLNKNISYIEYCPQEQKGIRSRGLVRGEEGELLLPTKGEGSTALALLMRPSQIMDATRLSFSLSNL